MRLRSFIPEGLIVSALLYLVPMSNNRCPYCSSETGIRTILYGLPEEEPDPAVYTTGGCCIFDGMPKFECIACGWTGRRLKNLANSKNIAAKG
jgi:hypothetical protein